MINHNMNKIKQIMCNKMIKPIKMLKMYFSKIQKNFNNKNLIKILI